MPAIGIAEILMTLFVAWIVLNILHYMSKSLSGKGGFWCVSNWLSGMNKKEEK